MNKILVLFCEGSHEPPYIYRLLKADGWRNRTDQNIGSYPTIIAGYLRAQLEQTESLSDEDPWNRNKGFIPWYILRKQHNENSFYILIFRLGGDSKYSQAQRCMKHFLIACGSEFNDTSGDSTPADLKISFFYDADKDITTRIDSFITNMGETLPNFCALLKTTFSEYYYLRQNVDNYAAIGLFIFHDSDGQGALEDHMLPLMKEGNQAIFDQAENYFRENHSESRGEKSFSWMFKKSLIGITGQLQRAGRSNSVIISDCDYITDAKITSFLPSQKLIEFVNTIFN